MEVSASEPRLADEIYLALGEMLVKWNQVELNLRSILNTWFDLGDSGKILTAHMGNVSLSDALKTFNAEFAPPDIQPHIQHLVAYVDRIRAYRNYYAHAIIQAVPSHDRTEGVGYTQQVEAKGRLAMVQERITAPQIRAVIVMCETAATYSAAIYGEKFTGSGGPAIGSPSLEKPPLPAPLTKPRHYPLTP